MNEPTSERDRLLWKQAKLRVAFRRHLYTYIVINAFLWAMWFFGDRNYVHEHVRWPWPLWVTLGWGIGIAFNFYHAYIDNKADAVEREYEKLKKR
ncbi:MAG TPA: 2TM domain-containing protein [Bacteroidia bacterium]|nr:2TM domain-containing protein [Bacteroidia bacterium]